MKVFSYIAPLVVVLLAAGWGFGVTLKVLLWDIFGVLPPVADCIDLGLEFALIVYIAVSCWRWRS